MRRATTRHLTALVATHRRPQPPPRPSAPASARPTMTARATPTPAAPPAPPTQGYTLPPPEYMAIVDAEPQPALSFSPDRTRVLELHRPPPLPPVADLARPELKLAGLRIDAELNARSRMSHYTRLSIITLAQGVTLPIGDDDDDDAVRGGKETPVTGLPAGAAINFVTWSNSGSTIAFTVRGTGEPGCGAVRGPLSLWVADVATGAARKVLDALNTVMDEHFFLDDATLGALIIPPGRGAPPCRATAPPVPRIEDNSHGATSAGRTYQDLLKDETDAALFEFYGESVPVLVDVASGATTTIGPPRLYTALSPSPDARYLAVSYLKRPFSYALPAGRFPRATELWTASADGGWASVATLADLPLADDVPIVMDSVRKGPRALSWRPDAPACLAWIEATDGGDPRADPADPAGARDVVYTATADALAAGEAPRRIAATEWRCGGVAWGAPDLALLYESQYRTRRSRVWAFAPGGEGGGDEPAKALLIDRVYEDAYSDPGSPLQARTPRGTYVLARPGGARRLLLAGRGAAPDGARPFLSVFDVDTKETVRVWRSAPPRYESPGSLLTPASLDGSVPADGLQLLLSREAEDEPPQSWIATLDVDAAVAAAAASASSSTPHEPTSDDAFAALAPLTAFPHPHPSLIGATKRLLRYKREDGVDLTATLHLPPGYDAARDGPLPAFVWLYPQEFKSAESASMLRISPHEFASVGPSSPLVHLAAGYCLIDNPSIPIVGGEKGEEPNDTYVTQLVASATAAVDAAVATGAVDRARIGVGGHSYGAFTTANLLAHAPDLFACGIARSGCYNRTLTPLGFQSEDRTIFDVPDVYLAMTPLLHANKITKPLLLIHGEADPNPGTFPMQSERLYAALKSQGVRSRLVILPHEGHGYRGHESVLHCLAESDDWLDRFARGA